MMRHIIFAGRQAYTPEALALFARMSAQPNITRKRLIDMTIRMLLAYGVWSSLRELYVVAAHDEQAARLNWISADALTGTGTFTADLGFAGDGGGGLGGLAGISPPAPNNVAVGCWAPAGVRGSQVTTILSASVRSSLTALLTKNGGSETSVGVGSSEGHAALSATAATTYSVYKNGVSVATPLNNGTAWAGNPTTLLGSPSNAADFAISAAHTGAALTAGQMAALYNALNTYMTGVL